jgi:aspartyl-tRNA(Asn)/glutamyl-tRNA(Gln) amidotransferase subunit A
MPVPEWDANLSDDLRGRKIGIPREYRIDGLNADVAKSWDDGIAWLKDAGAEIVDINLPHTRCAADLLHHRSGRSLVQSRAL